MKTTFYEIALSGRDAAELQDWLSQANGVEPLGGITECDGHPALVWFKSDRYLEPDQLPDGAAAIGRASEVAWWNDESAFYVESAVNLGQFM